MSDGNRRRQRKQAERPAPRIIRRDAWQRQPIAPRSVKWRNIQISIARRYPVPEHVANYAGRPARRAGDS